MTHVPERYAMDRRADRGKADQEGAVRHRGWARRGVRKQQDPRRCGSNVEAPVGLETAGGMAREVSPALGRSVTVGTTVSSSRTGCSVR